MLNGAEILTSLDGLESFFKGEEYHRDPGIALADLQALEYEFRPAAEGVARPDKGAVQTFMHPKAQVALQILRDIREAITPLDTAAGQQACRALRTLCIEQRWI
jgi:hypothetical protein